MALTKGDRINLIMSIVNGLWGREASYTYDEVNLILRTYGVGQLEEDGFGNFSVMDTVASASDAQLLEVGEFLGLTLPSRSAPVATATTVRSVEPMFVFASHLSAHRAFVGEIRQELGLFGIELFVAHDSISDDAAWHVEIERALDRADLGIVFLHQGFKQSDWCDQEVGWLLGRHVPVLPLNFGQTPYGPLGKTQANPVRDTTARGVADGLLERIAKQADVADSFAASLVKGMANSPRFNVTDRIWVHLRDLTIDANLGAQLLEATKSNDQIHRAGCAEGPYRRLIIDYLRRQPESPIIALDIDAYEKYLDEQDATAR